MSRTFPKTCGILLVTILATSGCLGWGDDVTEPWERPIDTDDSYNGDWPDLAQARVRPGSRILIGPGSACTTNFLFRTPDNATLYLGTAAHCLGDPDSGTGAPVTVPGFGFIGRTAYNAWEHGGNSSPDFALIRIHDASTVRAYVHPAMHHYGGPTALADSKQALPGTHVLGYANSTSRAPDDPKNPREGWIVSEDKGRLLHHTEHPGIPGDSGSGLMTKQRQALCVLILAFQNPLWDVLGPADTPNLNWCEPLDQAIEHAARNDPALERLELVTWDLLNGSRFPLGSSPP